MKHLLTFILTIFISALFGQNQKNVILLDRWTTDTIQPGLEEAIFNDVWGFEKDGENYAVIGSNIGTHVFKVTGRELEFIDFKPGAYQNRYVEHRDFKTYKNYLYGVCDEGTSSLQIFDISYLPDSVHKVYDSPEFFQVCHNIYIDTATAKLYASGANNIGLKVLDVSVPDNPELLYDYNDVGYVHDCYVRNDTAFFNCAFDGLRVYDFSTIPPAELGVLDFYPNQGYNHSGWMSPNGEWYAFIDETQGTRVHLCEVNELDKIAITETFGTKDYTEYVPHNIILLDYLAIVAYYNEGLRVYDISKFPAKEIGRFDTFLQNTNYKLNGAWGVYVFPEKDQILIADRQNGLYLFSFPVSALNTPRQETHISGTPPFIDENGLLIPRKHLHEDNLYFTITTIHGQVVCEQQNFLSFTKIPYPLAAGIYVFSIHNEFGDLLESGHFVKAN